MSARPRAIAAVNALALLVSLGAGAAVARVGGVNRASAVDRRASDGPATLVDATGAEVEVRRYQRIVAGSHVADHLVTSLAEREHILAVSGNGLPGATDPARFAGIPMFEELHDVEALIALGPDLVVVNNFVQAGAVAQLRAAGLAVFDLGEMHGLDTFLEDARTVGALIGEPARGERFARAFEARMRAVAADVPAEARPRGMYLGTHGVFFYGGGRGTSYHDVLVHGGVRDVAEHYYGWPSFTTEQVLELDPEVLVTSTGKGAEICRKPGLEELRPCRGEGRIVELAWELLVDPGTPMLDAAEALRRALHGDARAPGEAR